MRRLMLAALAGAAVPSVPMAASAVTYAFTVDAAFGYGSDVMGGFTYEPADPITALQFVDARSLTSCEVRYFGTPGYCGFVQFQPNDGGYDVIGFAIKPAESDIAQTFFYYFEEGALSRNGTYRTTVGVDNIGSLTVAKIGAAVPEPAAWALMITGFGLAGGALRRRRKGAAPAQPRFVAATF